MQEVKYFLRAIGTPSPTLGEAVVTAAEAEADLGYKYLSQGWTLNSTHYLGSVRDEKGNDAGYRVLHVLVREEKKVTVKEPK